MPGLSPTHRVFYGGNRQCTPLLERLGPAKAAGHSAISVWPGDLRGLDKADVARRIADAGLVVSEIEMIGSWMPAHAVSDSPFGEFLSAMTPERICPVAVELGASTVSTAELFGLAFDGREMARHFGEMCDKAAAHGVRIALEFVPTGGVPRLAEAWEIIDRAGRTNGGLMVDSWHFFRSNSSLDALARVPGDRIFSIQLNDAPATPEADLNTGMMNRRLPGEGGLDLAGFMQALAATGTNAFLGVETFSRALDAMPTQDAAQACADGIDHCLHLAEGNAR
jgi:sugar phosphate isomerase/epimerase